MHPRLQLAHCRLEGLDLSCDIPGLPLDAFDSINPLYDAASTIGGAVTSAASKLTSAFTDTFSSPAPASRNVVADDGSGIFLRMASSDGGTLTIDCAAKAPDAPPHTPVAREAMRVVAGCAYDYTSLLRFPCGGGGNGSAPAQIGCALGYDTWRLLPYSGCDTSGMADVRTSMSLNLKRTSVPGADQLTMVRQPHAKRPKQSPAGVCGGVLRRSGRVAGGIAQSMPPPQRAAILCRQVGWTALEQGSDHIFCLASDLPTLRPPLPPPPLRPTTVWTRERGATGCAGSQWRLGSCTRLARSCTLLAHALPAVEATPVVWRLVGPVSRPLAAWLPAPEKRHPLTQYPASSP